MKLYPDTESYKLALKLKEGELTPNNTNIGELYVNFAKDGGDTSFVLGCEVQKDVGGDSIKKQLRANLSLLNSMDVVAKIEEDRKFSYDGETLEWILKRFENLGDKVNREGFGEIILDKKRMKKGLSYLKTNEERLALALVPQVLSDGVEIGFHSEHKGRNYDTITFGAPVEINGTRGNMAVVVRKESANYYKAHRLIMPDGSQFSLETKEEDIAETAGGVKSNSGLSPTDNVSINSIPNSSENVNNDWVYEDERENEIEEAEANLEEGIRTAVGGNFGKIGKNTFNKFYEDGDDRIGYLGGFTAYYEAGKKGTDINDVKSDYADNLNSAQKEAAYLAGRYDGGALKTANVTETVAENSNVNTVSKNKLVRLKKEGTATLDNDVAGFVENENSRSFSLTEKRMLNKLAKALRVKIMISDDVRTPKGKEAEGSYGRSIIRISKNSENPLLDVLKHEVSHRIQELAPKEFNKFKKYAMKYGKRIGKTDKVEWDTAEVQNTYLTKAGQQHGNEGAMDEIVSDFAEFELMLNEGFINDIAENEPDLAKRILNWIKDIIATVKEALGIVEPSLERAQHLWENAIRKASKEANKAQKNTTDEGSGKVYSFNNTENENIIDISSDNELSKLVGEMHGSKKYNLIRDYILSNLENQTIKLSDGKIAVVNKSDAAHIAHKAGNKKTAIIAKLKEFIESATLFAEEESTKQRNFKKFYYYKAVVKYKDDVFPVYINVGEAYNDSSYHIYDITQKLRDTAHRLNDVDRLSKSIGLETVSPNNSIPNSSGNVNNKFSIKNDTSKKSTEESLREINVNAYGKTGDVKNFIETSDLLYLDKNKKRTKNWLQSVGVQFPADAIKLGSIGSITYQNGIVKIVGVPFKQYMQNTDKNTNTKEKFSIKNSGQDKGEGGTISHEERGVLLRYKSSESYKINAELRENGLDNLREEDIAFVEKMDSALKKLPKYKGKIYRNLVFDGFAGDEEGYNKFLSLHSPGSFVRYKAYTSASTDEQGYEVDGKYVVHMIVENSQNAHNLEGFGNNSESEVLYERNSIFIVREVKYDENGIPTIYLEEVNENGETTDGIRGHGQFYSEEQRRTMRDLHKTHSIHDNVSGISRENTNGNNVGQEVRVLGNEGNVEGVLREEEKRLNNKDSGKYSLKELKEYYKKDDLKNITLSDGRKLGELTLAEIYDLKDEDMSTTPKLEPFSDTGIDETIGKESKFYDSAMKSENVADETKRLIENANDIKYYIGISNIETLESANDKLNRGGAAETLRFVSMDKKSATAEDVAEGFILLKRYQDAGDFESATIVAQKLREIGTSAGQTVQAFSILGRMTPEGMAVYAQKELDSALKEMQKTRSEEWVEKHKAMFELTPEEMEFIKNNMEKASKLPDGRDKTILLAEISSMIQAKLPTNIRKQIKGYTRISMLLNPKTILSRNILGNVMMPE